MEVAATFTVWLTFGAWLFLPTVHAPARFSRIAIALCGAELLAVAVWSFGTENCDRRPCAAVPEAARSAAALDIPALTAVALVLGWLYAMRRARVLALPRCGSSSPAPAARSEPPRSMR